MTVEELNIKITADAENFKKAISDANAAMDSFKSRASEAGREVTEAFSGLIGVNAVGVSRAPAQETVAPVEISGRADAARDFAETMRSMGQASSGNAAAEPVREYERLSTVNTFAEPVREYEQPSAAGFAEYFRDTLNTVSGTVLIPETDSGGMPDVPAGGGANEVQPVNITTTVELDGDKVGESVSSYFLRRNKITNGISG